MDGENFMEEPMNKWDDLGGFPIIFGKHLSWILWKCLTFLARLNPAHPNSEFVWNPFLGQNFPTQRTRDQT